MPSCVVVVMPDSRGIAKPQGRPRRLEQLGTGPSDRHTGVLELFCRQDRLGNACLDQLVLLLVQCLGGRDNTRWRQKPQAGKGVGLQVVRSHNLRVKPDAILRGGRYP